MIEFFSIDGPWRNDACMGYAAIAMERAGIGSYTIRRVLAELLWCFEDTSVDRAAEFYNREVI